MDNHANYSINKLGLYLSNNAVSNTGTTSVMLYNPQIVSNVFLTDTINWMHISGYYHANGGEKYITIGDFKSFAAGDTLQIGGNTYPGAYYFIDDVSITKVSGCDTATSIHEYDDDFNFKLFPNPSNGEATIEYHLEQNEKGIINIYDLTGKLIEHHPLDHINTELLLTTNLNNGIYLYQVIVNNRAVKSDKLVIIR